MRLLTTLLLLTLFHTIPNLHAQATTPLTKAIRHENFAEAKKHLTQELVNKADRGQYHPLTYAVYTGNNELIEALLKAGANARVVEYNGKTPLFVAANFNNAKAIELLVKYGATYPKKDNPYQPAKIAVIENAPKALKALFKAYPNIDLKTGWKKPNGYPSGMSRSGGALNHAARYGYDEIAIFLLGKNPNLNAKQSWIENFYIVGSDFRGKKALHNAAENKKCSVKLVNGLLKAGCDPFEKTPYSHLQCSTPLDYAAAADSIAKLKAMLASCDLKNKNHRSAISRAIFIASANSHKKTTLYLLSLLKKPLPNPEKWLAKYGKGSTSFNRHNSIREGFLGVLTPRVNPNQSALNATGTLAIISSPSLQNTASLLSVELSSMKFLDKYQ